MEYLVGEAGHRKIIQIDKEQFCNAVSNALFMQHQKNPEKLNITYWDLANILPDIIFNEVIEDKKDIFSVK
jgi:hypothetical protein